MKLLHHFYSTIGVSLGPLPCKKWKKFDVEPTDWHLIEGGYQANDNPFVGNVYESLSDAEVSINDELSKES